MKNFVKSHLNLLYTVELEYPSSDYHYQELQDIVAQVAENTELEGFEMYSVNTCSFNKKHYRTSVRNPYQLTFNFSLQVDGYTWDKLEKVSSTVPVPLVKEVKVKAIVTGLQESNKIVAKKKIEAVSDSPLDIAIAEAVNVTETMQGKKGYYRALQKALKKVKSMDKSLVPVRLNAKTRDLEAAAESLRSKVVEKSTGHDTANKVVEFVRVALEDDIPLAKDAALEDIRSSLEPQEYGMLVA